MATEPKRDSAFRGEQYQLSYPDGIEQHWWYGVRNPLVMRHLRRRSGAGAKVLDVGCGRGIMVGYLRQHRIDCQGVELAKVPPMPGIEEHVRSGVDACTLPRSERDRYTVLLLLDVIEHIDDPVSFLRGLIDAFANVKSILITVPARSEVWSNYDTFFGHYRRYRLPMIDELGTAIGWPVGTKQYFFHSLYVAARLLKIFRRDRSLAVRAPTESTVRLHRIVARALTLEHRLLPSRLPGLSIIADLTRP